MFGAAFGPVSGVRMSRCLTSAEFDALRSGDLSPDKACRAQDHLATCAACKAAFAALNAQLHDAEHLRDETATSLYDLDKAINSSNETCEQDAPIGDIPANTLPGYEITREIHRGGQGVVYQAIQKSTRRKVAIKVLREGVFAGRHDRARFEREVHILGQLKHPNIVAIHDSGTAASHTYFVMDYIAGQSLDAWKRGAPRSIHETLDLFAKICDAVNAAHLHGVIHRDLKPGNIRVDSAGEPHVLDFGLAKTVASHDTVMTMTGQFMGSLPWASPEQAEGIPRHIDTRTDVYALGVILYQLLTGHFPYDVTGTVRDVLDRILTATPTRPAAYRSEIGSELETILAKCLNKERERRYQTAGELGRDIRHYLAGEPIEARRDSMLYLVRSRTSRAIRQHPLAACTIVVLIAIIFAHTAGVELVQNLTPMHKAFTRWAFHTMPTAAVNEPFHNVRVVKLSDQTDPAVLAAHVELSVDELRSDAKALRRVHGRLMERLANAGARVVAWDITFRGETPHDATFVDGVRAMHAAGGAVVAAIGRWSLGVDGRGGLSPSIAAADRWGCTPAGFDADGPWLCPLAVQRGLDDPMPSLAIAAVGAYRHPDQQIALRVDRNAEVLRVGYYHPEQRTLRSRVFTDGSDEFQLSAVGTPGADAPAVGLQANDRIAYYLLRRLPSDAALAASTLDLQHALSCDEATLREAVDGRIVLVGDARGQHAQYATPDGRHLWGTYAHALTMDMLLSDATVRVLSLSGCIAYSTIGALLGVAIGWVIAGRSVFRAVALVATATVLIALGFGGVWFARTLCNPLSAVLALFIAAELTAAVHRLCQFRRA